MFGRMTALKQMEKAFQDQIAILEKRLDEQTKAAEKLAANAFLIGIRTENRSNIFTFSRKGELFEVRTFSMLSDNVPGWKRDLLE